MKQKMEGESILHEENIPIIRQRNPLSFSSHSRRSYFGTTSCIRKLSSLILILWLLVESVEAQGPACSCTPTVYRWRINFDGTCPPNNVQSGPGTGLSGVSCDISTINSPITNITYVQILELGPTLAQVLKAETSRDIALNDTVIEFSSVTSALPSVYAVGLQFFARANTESSGTVELQWIVSFSNICEKTVFQNGNSLGWLTFENLVPPRESTCAFSSESPSLYPSSAPSESPSKLPSAFPSIAPSNVASMNYNPSRLLFTDLDELDTFGIPLEDPLDPYQLPETKKQTNTKRHRISVTLRP